MDLPLSTNKEECTECNLCGQSCENDQVCSEHMDNSKLCPSPMETDDLETIASIDIHEERSDGSSNEIDSSHQVLDIYPCLECEKVFKSKNGMSRHVKINHSYGNGFNCKMCSQVFATKLLLKDHIIGSHSDDLRINKCTVCDKIFADKATLSQHFKSHRTDRPFKCTVCGKTYKEKRDLNNHEKSHSGIREHSCDQCGKSFIRPRDLKLHIETHSDLKPFKCNACNKAFRTSVNLKIHMKHHTDPHAFECFICEKKFAGKHTLKRHLVTHRRKKNFPCFQCNKAYHFKHKLEHHIKSVHNKERHYECQDCSKKFATKDNLKIHARVHNGERPYQCSMCPRAFSQVSNKQRHELTHKAIKPFKCSTCNKGFYTQYECKRHMLVHETPDGKPFKCTECGKGFVKAYSLRGHVQRIHQGIRHTCTICQKSFKIAFYFQQHMKNHANTGKDGEKSQEDSGMEETGCSEEQENKHCSLQEQEAAESQVDNMESTLLDVGEGKTSNSQASDLYDPTVRPYSCAHCSQSFRREQDMKRHIRHVHKDFTCNLCKKLFMDESELVSHASACPGSEKLLMCPECGNIFSSKANLKRHLEIHNGAEPKQCQQCQKIFRNEKLLKRHQVTHSDERAFQCTTCDKAFRRAEDLVKHTRTHTGEAPYKCRYCEKAFKQCNNRQRHEQTHILEKRFKCEICDRSFCAASELKEHTLTHQVPDGKYFKCDLCKRGFSHSKSLKSHVKNVHLNPKHGCNMCSQKFPTAREAKRHKKMHLVASVDLPRQNERIVEDSVLEQEVKAGQRYRETAEQQQVPKGGNGVRQEGQVRESDREGVEPRGTRGENEMRINKILLVSEVVDQHSDQTREDGEVPVLGGDGTDIEVENYCSMVGKIDKGNQVNNKVSRGSRNGRGQTRKIRLVNVRIRENASEERITDNVGTNEQIRQADEETPNVCQVRKTVVTRNNAKRVDHTTKHVERNDSQKRKGNEGRNEGTKDVTESDEREDAGTSKNGPEDMRGFVGITGGNIEAIQVPVFSTGNDGNASESASPEQRNDVTNTTHTDEKNDACKSRNKKGNENFTETNEANYDAIRKVLEGKPFICPLCDKGFSSRNGLRHHYYKTHQNSSDQNTAMHFYYCHECKEGFKTKKKFWLHDLKVHGLIETSSDESDSEMGAGQRVVITNTTDARKDVTYTTRPSEIENDLSTNRDDTGVEKVDGRLVIQSKITDWFRSK